MSRRRKPNGPPLEDLEAAIGHRFAERALLLEALTHSSAATQSAPDNQRLEFLGDRVLGLAIAEALLARFPGQAEGALAPRLNALVRRETCAAVAKTLDLGAYMRLGRSEAMTGGREKTALLGDAMEALIAAVHRDGGADAARALVLRLWRSRLDGQDETPIDAKTALQEWAQARAMTPPSYALIAREGPDHAPEFHMRAALATGEAAVGVGATKRAAEQTAAAALLKAVAPDEADEPS